MSEPLTDSPAVPAVKVRSSTLIQFPALASETTLIVHWPPVTATGTTRWIHPPAETGRSVRCSLPPQFLRAR